MNINQKIFQKHCNCEVKVERNYMPKKHLSVTRKSNPELYGLLHAITTTPPALICVTHQRWLKWLSSAEADAIESVLAEPKTPPRRVQRGVRLDDLPLTYLK